MTEEEPPTAVDGPQSKPTGDKSYRSNRLPAGVTMVQIKHRFAAIRVRSGGNLALRTKADGPWTPIAISVVGRAKRPWVLRVTLADGSVIHLRPFKPGEAGLPDVGSRVGGIGDSAPLGDDPISAVIAVFAIAFYVLAAPFFAWSAITRARAAKALQQQLQPNT